MFNPYVWLLHSRTRLAPRGCRLYDVPHKGAERCLSEKEVQENFDYFMRVRQDRLNHFEGWPRLHFWVDAPLNGDGIIALSKWMDTYGGGLLRKSNASSAVVCSEIFATHKPPWTGRNAGFNAALPLATLGPSRRISVAPQACSMQAG